MSWKQRLAIILGLVVALGSAWGYKRYIESQRQFQKVLVAGREILPYTTITEQDLAWRSVPVGALEPGTVQNPKQAIGRVSSSIIYRGEQIRAERLGESMLTVGYGERAVAVPTDPVRSAGGTLRPGDVVDVYYISHPDTPASLVAPGAVVLDVKDQQNKSLFGVPVSQSVMAQVGQVQQPVAPAGLPQVAVLKVRNDHVPGLVQSLASGQVVLVKAGADALNRSSSVEQQPEGMKP